MSRIGRMSIKIPRGMEVSFDNSILLIKKGSSGQEVSLPSFLQAAVEGDNLSILVANNNDYKQKKYWGLYRSNIKNIISGFEKPFSKVLNIKGVGYRAMVEGRDIVLFLGYSHAIIYSLPTGIDASVKSDNLTLSGTNKQLVGSVAAKIRSLRLPEPYKGKGIRLENEFVRQKEGKR